MFIRSNSSLHFDGYRHVDLRHHIIRRSRREGITILLPRAGLRESVQGGQGKRIPMSSSTRSSSDNQEHEREDGVVEAPWVMRIYVRDLRTEAGRAYGMVSTIAWP